MKSAYSTRAAALLLALAVSGGLWAYQSMFTADPTDPMYGPAPANTPCQRAPMQTMPSPTCIDPPGQWDMFSAQSATHASATFPDTEHPSGISADLAWRITAGRPDVETVVFDSGVNYDHVDLRNQIWLNRGELPTPNAACPMRNPADAYDCDGDGIFNIKDYSGDSRITDTILPGVLSRSDLRVFEGDLDGDGNADDDGNGYVDDISGFDFDDVDGDEYDHRDFGHGTGRNGVLGAEANNAVGIAGMCTNCRITNARIEDTYVVVRAETTANAAVWAADHGFEIINMSLGHVGASSMSRKAFEYAYSRNVLPFSAIANEFHFHQGFVGLYDEVFAVGALSYAGPTTAGIAPNNGQPTQAPTTYLRKANYSNYGAHLNVVAPSDTLTTNQAGGWGDSGGTSSATPHVAGTAALVYSAFRDCRDKLSGTPAVCQLDAMGQALQDISNQEVRQVINQTAYDIKEADDSGGTGTRVPGTYPVTAGWDKWTGYGRVDAKKAVDLIQSGKIPPEADINSPDWYTYVTGTVPVKFYANNRWRGGYNWVLEFGVGVEPTSFTQIQAGSGAADKSLASTSLVNNSPSVNWDTAALADGGYTLRLRVSDAGDAAIKGEDRMFVWVRRGLVDPATPGNHPNFPIRVTRTFNGEVIPISVESMSNALVDLDGDNTLEIILSTADGEVRAYRQDGTLMPGFPVMTQPLPGLPGNRSPAFDGNLANGEVPVTGAFIIGGVAVGDIDADFTQEICAGAVNGKLYCWNSDGSVQAGFPVSVDIPKDFDQYTQAVTTRDLPQGEALVAPPTLRNLDGDTAGTLEIAAVARDQKLYVWKADGSRLAGFPVALGTISAKNSFGSISGVLMADIDNDGQQDILVGTNEVSGSLPNTAGRIYAFSRAGVAKTGWPVSPSSASANGVPIVAQGVVNGPLAGNLDADAQLEVVGHAFLGDAIIYNHDGSQVRTLSGNHNASGTAPDTLEDTPTGGPGRADDAPVHTYVGLGAIADFSSTAGLEYLVGTVGNNLVVDVAAGSGQVTNFDHYFSAWNTGNGTHLANFPRVVDGWQFVSGPAVADLDGAGGQEAIVTSSGYFVHAFNNGTGANIAGWPKFTGHWETNTPSVGDLDDDGTVDVVTSTRLGYVHAWQTTGPACVGAGINAQWRKYRHDEWNTGAFGTDTLRPATVNDSVLTVVNGVVTANFTAVGDDGRCGTASRYELLRNGTTVAGLPAPKASGLLENLSLPGVATDSYVLRVVDEANNASPAATLIPADTAQRIFPTDRTGGLGQSLTASTFALINNDTTDRQVSAITLTFTRPDLFSEVVLDGPSGSVTVTQPAASQTFTFSAPQTVQANGTAIFQLTATLTNQRVVADNGKILLAGSSLALLGLIGLCLTRLRHGWVLLAAGLMLAGCNSGNSPAPAPVAPVIRVTSQQALASVVATRQDGETVSYAPLPLDLGRVTLEYR